MNQSRPPIFVVGSQRSGTSVFTRILSAHPHLYVTNESETLKLAQQTHQALEETLGRYLGKDNESAWIQLTARHVENVFAQILKAAGKTRWGDKLPQYSYEMDALDRYFPECQFIHMIRDGRDSACSMLQHKRKCTVWHNAEWAPATWHGAAAAWYGFVNAAMTYGRQLPAHRYLEIRYEELVLDHEDVTAKICDYLGEPPAPNLIHAASLLDQDKIRNHQQQMDQVALDEWHTHRDASRLLARLGYEFSISEKVTAQKQLEPVQNKESLSGASAAQVQ